MTPSARDANGGMRISSVARSAVGLSVAPVVDVVAHLPLVPSFLLFPSESQTSLERDPPCVQIHLEFKTSYDSGCQKISSPFVTYLFYNSTIPKAVEFASASMREINVSN